MVWRELDPGRRRIHEHGLDRKDADMTDREAAGATRRAVLLGAGAIGAAGVLAACATSTQTPPAGSGGNEAPPSPETIKVADIHVGGGAIYPVQGVVVTQPVAGQFKAFSSICTHQGCMVTHIDQGKITCPCHGSQYSIADGSVIQGPAPAPLPQKTATVTGDTITVS
jgi:Rieske Fe-S protein